jgi:hypothetical protein
LFPHRYKPTLLHLFQQLFCFVVIIDFVSINDRSS